MADKIKKGDFVEIDYVGKEKESDIIFDTTKEDIAKKNNLYDQNAAYKPLIICVGEKQILAGLDKNLEGKEADKNYSFEIIPEQGFGKKNAKLLRIIPESVFKKQELKPYPGLQINVDGTIGTVKHAGGGRIIVDFNHPLSGKTLVYDVDVKKIITDKKEQIKSFFDLIKIKDVDIDLNGDEAKIKLKMPLPDYIKESFSKKLQDLVKIKKVSFEANQIKTKIKNPRLKLNKP